LIDYPVGFKELAGYTEEERRIIWKDYKEVYDKIKTEKIRDIMARDTGVFSISC
jgi:hypothetical protein